MAIAAFRRLTPKPNLHSSAAARAKTTSAQSVASRSTDPTFDKLMDGYKNLIKVVSVQDLILSSPGNSLSLPFLSSLAQKLHLNRGAPYFLRKYPHIFTFFYNHSESQPFVRLTDAATEIARQESTAAAANTMIAVERLRCLLRMSASRTLPLRAIFKVWRELGLPDDFEDSVISQNPKTFSVRDNPREPNTHVLELVETQDDTILRPAVENWRDSLRNKEDSKLDELEIRFGFKQEFPPGMKLKKSFRARVKEWQRLPYLGPYDENETGMKRSKVAVRGLEKRAVGIVHEFLSLTVEKMVEVERISHFRKSFGIDFNMRDLFLDHPGMFYLSAKGKRHTVFLREAYNRGCVIERNPVYDARRKLLHLVLLGKRGIITPDSEESRSLGQEEESSSDV